MNTIRNQTIYQCEYCGKRLLSKNGAKIHEHEYCHHPTSPHKIAIIKKQNACNHKNKHMTHSTIPGEAISQPECYVCDDCGKEGV